MHKFLAVILTTLSLTVQGQCPEPKIDDHFIWNNHQHPSDYDSIVSLVIHFEYPYLEKRNIELRNFILGELYKFANLRQLNWNSYPTLKSIPPEITQLKCLRLLAIRSSEILAIPTQINQLTFLDELDLRENPIFELPIEIGDLQKAKDFESI